LEADLGFFSHVMLRGVHLKDVAAAQTTRNHHPKSKEEMRLKIGGVSFGTQIDAPPSLTHMKSFIIFVRKVLVV
jgi:hypothetical protein